MTLTVHKDYSQYPVREYAYSHPETPNVGDVIALQDRYEHIPGRLEFWGKIFSIFGVSAFLASCANITISDQAPVVRPTGTATSIGPDTAPTTALGSVETLVVPPGTPVVELPPQQEFDDVSDQASPAWIAGGPPSIDSADDLEPSPWDGARYASVRQRGLVPVLEGGVVVNYRDNNGLVYGPVLAQISSEDGTVLIANGGVQPGGIMEYVSLDGKVKRYVRAGIACPDGVTCLRVVSYNSEDAGGLYWVQVDANTGEITSYSPAVTEDEPGRATWLPVGDRWSSALSGPIALQAGEGYGIDYQRSVDGATNVFYFAAGDKEYQAKDREIHYTPTDKRLWVENESGIFLFDNTTHEWTRVAEQGTQMIGAGDAQMIIADEAWHTVESIDGSSGVQIVTTQDGQKWAWGQDGWARYEAPSLAPPFSPELVKSLEDNGLSVSPDDLCLWEGTEGATVQCLTLNPEAVPELADNLRQMTNTVAWLYTWDKKNAIPGKYPTLASYEAMLKRQPLQKAVDVPVIWHPESAPLDPSAALWQKASELAGPDGKSVGVDATIDLSAVGFVLEDWESVKDEGGWTGMDGAVVVKQALEPVEGQVGVWRIVWRVALDDTKTTAIAKYGNDVIDKINLLFSDPLQPIDENSAAYNQSFRLLDDLFKMIVDDAKGSLLYSGKGIQFAKLGRGSFEQREKLKEGIEFFVTGK